VEGPLLALAGWLDAAGVRDWASEVAWVYPTANTLHLLGLVMLVGGIGVVDLRVLGLWRRLPLAELSRALTPVAMAGLMLLAATGIVLFGADGAALARSGTFHRKLVLIALALANAAAFRWLWRDPVEPLPAGAKVMAGASLLLWLAVGTLGRWIAYS
jgi:hypothetical protein